MLRGSPLFLLSLLLFILGCSTGKKPVLPQATTRVVSNAQSIGFTQELIPTRTFLLTSFQKLSGTEINGTPNLSGAEINGTPNLSGTALLGTPNLTIYAFIEGDGRSWKTKYKLSNNPTPHQPLALKLAVLSADATDRQVVYLARPCQYTPHNLDKSCEPKYWSSHRYAVEVIESINEALDHIKAKAHNHDFVLVGFSGGASVAALIAAKRNDIAGLITVAGDLDNQALNAHHGTTPLHGSLNPMDIALKLKQLPQAHWSGSDDKVVPVWVAQRFVNKVDSPCARQYILQKAEHHQGWESHWPTIMKTSLTCTKN